MSDTCTLINNQSVNETRGDEKLNKSAVFSVGIDEEVVFKFLFKIFLKIILNLKCVVCTKEKLPLKWLVQQRQGPQTLK